MANTTGLEIKSAILFFCIFALCSILHSIVVMTYISALTFVTWTIYVVIRKPPFLLKYLYVFFNVFATIAGCFYIEVFPSVWLVELQETGHFVGALPLLVFCNWILLVGLLCFDSKWGCEREGLVTSDNSSHRTIVLTFAWITLIFSAASFLSILYEPSFISGLDRFAFDSLHSGNVLLTVASKALPYLIISSFLVIRDGKRALGIISIIFYCLFLFWTGEKFGGFFSLACMLIFVYYDAIIEFAKKATWKLIAMIICCAIALIGVACFAYSLVSSNSISDFLGYRVAAQGQLWWATYERVDGSYHFDEIKDEVNALGKDGNNVASNVGSNNGIYKIMYFTAPQSIIDAKLARGSRYTSAGFAAAYYYGGVFGSVLFSLFLVFANGLVTNALIRALRGCRLINSVVLFRLFMLVQVFFSTFLFSVLVEPSTLLILIYLFVIWAFQKRRQVGSVSRKELDGDIS